MKRSNPVVRWWLSLDKVVLWSFIILFIIGTILVATASPAVAARIGFSANHFISNHITYLALSLLVALNISCLDPSLLKFLSLTNFIIILVALVVVLKFGPEIKGARRWIHVLGFSLQPSELMKPLFALSNALILSSGNRYRYQISLLIYCTVIGLLIAEPDLGVSILITIIWLGQIIITGIPIIYLITATIAMILALSISYLALPHVQHRVDNFLNPSKGDNFQVNKSLSAFSKGGMIGTGPGEGKVKLSIPDSHSDFIFAVAAEEFGLLLCLAIVTIYLMVTLRITLYLINMDDDFRVIALTGIILQISSQALINMGVNIHLLPTKGITLPFISYGGSSTLSNSLSLGILLNLTKTQFQTRLKND